MKRIAAGIAAIAAMGFTASAVAAGSAPAPAATTPNSTRDKGNAMQIAEGTFDVKVAPVASEPFADGTGLGRFSLDKQLHGDLEATGHGEMLTGGTPVQGSAGYVAMERIEGTLHGRRGSFLLQHLGTMSGGSAELKIAVVPDSGTGELAGLQGTFEILIASDGKHSYRFTYSLQAPPR